MNHPVPPAPNRSAPRAVAPGDGWRFFLPIVCLVPLFALAACGGGEAPASGDASPTAAAPTAGGYRAGAIEDAGRIEGRILFEGEPPVLEPVKITKDRAVCAAVEHRPEKLVVGEGGALRYAVVSIDGITSGKPFATEERPTLDQRGCWFIPHITVVPAGAELDILNSDGILHNLHTFPNHNRAINIAQPKFKKRITQRFEAADRIRVTCDVHSWMSSWIIVVEHPYYVVSAADGSYSLGDVPPGTYTVTVWHESLGSRQSQVTVAPGAVAEASFSFGG